MPRAFLLGAVLWTTVASFGLAAETELPEGGIRLGDKQGQRWLIGLRVQAKGPCFGVFATVPLPTDWAEQHVEIVNEDTSPHVGSIEFREVDGGVKQMVVLMPRINAGEEAKALLTVAVTRHHILPPEDTAQFVSPQRPPRDVLKLTGPSPYIESRHAQIVKLAKELANEAEQKNLDAWQTVELYYDWVREHVEYQNGSLKGALAALRDGNGDCEELTSLFIAICRANKVPARTVWIPGHCYPEFYLEDTNGAGHWFPCQAAGTRAFGEMPEYRPILQKGDNFRVPEHKTPQRYVAEFCKMKSVSGAKPHVIFVREFLDEIE
ncbi:MAG: hypothetical protein KDA47_01560 [Planctomycetales bacterium]|nr:hypothetical protein [Planctomycetales bacterium]